MFGRNKQTRQEQVNEVADLYRAQNWGLDFYESEQRILTTLRKSKTAAGENTEHDDIAIEALGIVISELKEKQQTFFRS